MGATVLGELPLVPGVSTGGDLGLPYALVSNLQEAGATEWRKAMEEIAAVVAREVLNVP